MEHHAGYIPTCNICGHTGFAPIKNREGERCLKCGSLRRIRMAWACYKKHGMLDAEQGTLRVLHFAPEKCIRETIKKKIGIGYMPADAAPDSSQYKGFGCLRLFMQDGLDVFPDEYFDFIIHNHVMEHVPGSYKETLLAQLRALKIGGSLIFSVPGPKMSQKTIEGGENMSSDEERKRIFGKKNHIKLFGGDLIDLMKTHPNTEFFWDGLTEGQRQEISVPKSSCRIMIWQKTGSSH